MGGGGSAFNDPQPVWSFCTEWPCCHRSGSEEVAGGRCPGRVEKAWLLEEEWLWRGAGLSLGPLGSGAGWQQGVWRMEVETPTLLMGVEGVFPGHSLLCAAYVHFFSWHPGAPQAGPSKPGAASCRCVDSGGYQGPDWPLAFGRLSVQMTPRWLGHRADLSPSPAWACSPPHPGRLAQARA